GRDLSWLLLDQSVPASHQGRTMANRGRRTVQPWNGGRGRSARQGQAGAGGAPAGQRRARVAARGQAVHVRRGVCRERPLGGRRADVLVALDPAVLTTGADLDRFFGSTGWRDSATLPDTERYPYLVTRYREALERTGLDLVTHVELVDDSGASQLLFFATAVEK